MFITNTEERGEKKMEKETANTNEDIQDEAASETSLTQTQVAEEKPKEKKRFTMFGVEVVYLYFFGIIVAHWGWLIENAVRLANQGYIEDKFHLLPFISPYSLIVFGFHLALRDPDDVVIFGKKIFKTKTVKTMILSNIISFLLISTFVFLGELAIGNLWGECFGIGLWDYSSWPLNVTRYTSIVSTFGFGGGAYLIFRFIYRPMLNFIRRKVNFKVAKVVTLTLGMAIIVDTCILMGHIMITGEVVHYWHWQIYIPE